MVGRKSSDFFVMYFFIIKNRPTEKYMFDLLKSKKQNLTILLISHRLSKLKDIADRIYIIENKSISHFGSHNDLIQSINFYSEVV